MAIKLIHDDCIAALKGIEPNVDLIVTSPPYNAGKQYETKLALDEYRSFAKEWVSLATGALSKNGSFWLNVGYTKLGKNQTLPLTYLYYEVCPLPLVQEIVWQYEGGMSYSKRFAHRTERWMWFAANPGKAKFNLNEIRTRPKMFDIRNNPDGKNPTDCWYFNRVTNNSPDKYGHPCPFPVPMVARIIKACSDPGDHIMDPFMGSGTTGYVSKVLGRSFTGIEKSKRYFKTARQRIEDLAFPLIYQP